MELHEDKKCYSREKDTRDLELMLHCFCAAVFLVFRTNSSSNNCNNRKKKKKKNAADSFQFKGPTLDPQTNTNFVVVC